MNNKNEDSRILKCQHVSLEVSDVNVSLEFYRKFLNMKLTERHRAGEHKDIPFEMAFLRLNKQHHDLVLTHNPNRKYTKKNDDKVPVDEKKWRNVKDKLKYLSEQPGKGD